MKLSPSKIAIVSGGLALALTAVLFQNCSQSPEIVTTSLNNSSSGLNDPNRLQISPTDAFISAGATQILSIKGGTQPYTWSISPTGCGTFDTSTKTYMAPSTGSNVCTFTILDAKGAQVRSIISVTENAMTATYSPNPAAVSASVEITPSGGTPGYTYSIVSGGGALTGYIYRAPANVETAIVKITDAQGKSINLSINIGGGSGGSGGGGTQQIFRTFAARLGDFMHTKLSGEGSPTYATQTSSTITTFTSGSSTRKEIFRCFSSMHSVSLSSGCGGANNEGSLGFLENAQTSSATKQVFMCNSFSSFMTTSAAECASIGLTSTAIGFAP